MTSGQSAGQPGSKKKNSAAKPFSGVDDVLALTLIFSGTCSLEVLKQMSYQQIFFYVFFILSLTRSKE